MNPGSFYQGLRTGAAWGMEASLALWGGRHTRSQVYGCERMLAARWLPPRGWRPLGLRQPRGEGDGWPVPSRRDFLGAKVRGKYGGCKLFGRDLQIVENQ